MRSCGNHVHLLEGGQFPGVQLPIDSGHGVGVDAGAIRQAERSVRCTPAHSGLAAGHLRAFLAAALNPFAMHLVTSHSAHMLLSNCILTPYKHLI